MLKNYKDKLFFILPLFVFIFWFWIYPYHLLYQEKITLFLYRSDFFTDKLLLPGGLSKYIGLYLTQFYTSPWVTSILMTFIFTSLFILITGILQKTNIIKSGRAFCWLPSLALLGMQTHYDFFLSETLKVLFFYIIIYGYVYIPPSFLKKMSAVLLAPLFFVLLGGGFYSILYLTFIILGLNKKKNNWKSIIAYLIIGFTLPVIWKYFILLSKQEIYGFFYFESINNWNITTYIIILFLPLLFLLKKIRFLSFIYSKKSFRKTGLVFNYVIILYFIIQLSLNCYHPQVEKIFHIEYALTQENWDEILELSKKYKGENYSVAVITNLALAKKGILNEQLFEYTQIGVWGLVHPPESTYFFNLHNSEVYAHLGNLNESFHCLFEASVSGFDIHSSYILKKLTEHLIQYGKYNAAKSYLLQLLYTKHHEEWARKTLRNLPKEDTFIKVAPGEQDFIMNILGPFNNFINMAQNNPQNTHVRDYLLLGFLLEKQLEEYYNFFQLYYSSFNKNNKLPKIYEEALLLIYQEIDKDVLEKFPLSPETLNLFDNYTQDLNKRITIKGTEKLKEKYGNTFWFYHHFSNLKPF